MEGLLPLVYKAIKKNRTRRHYECLSSGGGGAYSINMAEMYSQNHSNQSAAERSSIVGHHNHHRRHKSVGDFENGFRSPQTMRTGVGASSPKLVRFRSQRMFSCITGA